MENEKSSMWNLPNRLTMIRIVLIPVFVALFFIDFPWHRLIAMVVFFVASITDFFDGMIARKRNLVTNLGKFLDPMADKMLVCCGLIAVVMTAPSVQNNPDPYQISLTIFAMVIIARELMVSGFRTVAASKGVVLAADMVGKVKTTTQMAAMLLLIPAADAFKQNASDGEIVFFVGFALLALATLLTIISAVNYLVKNRTVLEG